MILLKLRLAKANRVTASLKKVDYTHLEIDEDRKAFFISTYEKFLNSQKTDDQSEKTTSPVSDMQEPKKSRVM
jgi:hypothetical protein